MLRRAFFALLASSTVFAAPEIDLGLTPEMLHAIIREVAAKIDARYGSERPEAEKLVERIEAILATAGAAKIGDCDTAHRLLDECAKETPGDLMIRHQRIATLLRQSQSKATIKKATLLYGDITPDTILEKTALLEPSARHLFLQTYLLHHLLKPETQTVSELLTRLLEEKAIDEATGKDVRKWMEK